MNYRYDLKQFYFLRLSSLISLPPSQPANNLLPPLAQSLRTKRDCGSYASRVLSRSACSSNSTSRSYWQKKDNHNSWINLGYRIEYIMCICGTSLVFLAKFSLGSYKQYYLFIFRTAYARSRSYIRGHIFGLSNAVRNYCACNPRSYLLLASSMVHSSILP